MAISDPSHWMEDYKFKGPKYAKIAEIIAAINTNGMIGSANSDYIAMTHEGNDNLIITAHSLGAHFNVGSTNYAWCFQLPLPSNRGGKKLYIKGYRLCVAAADASDYVDRVRIIGNNAAGDTVKYTDLTNRIAPTTVVQSFGGDIDMSSYFTVTASINIFSTTTLQLKILSPELDCYYAP